MKKALLAKSQKKTEKKQKSALWQRWPNLMNGNEIDKRRLKQHKTLVTE